MFKKLYGDKVYLLAMTAENEYLEHNLQLRSPEKGINKTARLKSAAEEIKTIQKMREEKLIDNIIKVGWDNRDKLSELAIKEVSQVIKPRPEGENKLKFK